jgi:hypothetical protein
LSFKFCNIKKYLNILYQRAYDENQRVAIPMFDFIILFTRLGYDLLCHLFNLLTSKDILNFNLNSLWGKSKVGGLDLSRRDLDRDLNLDAKKKSVSTVEIFSTV